MYRIYAQADNHGLLVRIGASYANLAKALARAATIPGHLAFRIKQVSPRGEAEVLIHERSPQ